MRCLTADLVLQTMSDFHVWYVKLNLFSLIRSKTGSSSIRISYTKLLNLKVILFALQKHTLLFVIIAGRFSNVVCPNDILLRCLMNHLEALDPINPCCPLVRPLFLWKPRWLWTWPIRTPHKSGNLRSLTLGYPLLLKYTINHLSILLTYWSQIKH